MNQNGIYLPFGSPGKRKIIFIVNAIDLKCSLLCFLPQRLLSSAQFFIGKINAKDIFTTQRILCFRLAADIPNKLTLKIRLSSRRTQIFFFFPIINLPTLKAALAFRHNVFDANATSRRLLQGQAQLVSYCLLIMGVLSAMRESHQISSYGW